MANDRIQYGHQWKTMKILSTQSTLSPILCMCHIATKAVTFVCFCSTSILFQKWLRVRLRSPESILQGLRVRNLIQAGSLSCHQMNSVKALKEDRWTVVTIFLITNIQTRVRVWSIQFRLCDDNEFLIQWPNDALQTHAVTVLSLVRQCRCHHVQCWHWSGSTPTVRVTLW